MAFKYAGRVSFTITTVNYYLEWVFFFQMLPCPIISTKPINRQRFGQRKPCFFCCNAVESVPRVSVKSPAIHPGFKIHHHQSQRRRPNVAGMPFRTPSVFLFLRIRHHGRKGGRPWLCFFLFYIPDLKKLQKKTCQQKWFCLIVVSWVFWLNILDLQDDEDQPKKNDGMFPHLGTEDLRGEKKSWEITTHDPWDFLINLPEKIEDDSGCRQLRVFFGRDRNYFCVLRLSGELRGWRSIGKDATLATREEKDVKTGVGHQLVS